MSAPVIIGRATLYLGVMRKLGCRTQQSLGDRIGVVRSTVGGWLCGKTAVPRHVAMLLRLLGAA